MAKEYAFKDLPEKVRERIVEENTQTILEEYYDKAREEAQFMLYEDMAGFEHTLSDWQEGKY